MAEADTRRRGDTEAAGNLGIDGNRETMRTTRVVVMLVHRAIVAVMMGAGQGLGVGVSLAAGIHEVAATGDGIIAHGRRHAGVQPGEHANNHDPCKDSSHQRAQTR